MKIITDVTLGALLFEGLNLPVAARNLAETNTGRRASRLKMHVVLRFKLQSSPDIQSAGEMANRIGTSHH